MKMIKSLLFLSPVLALSLLAACGSASRTPSPTASSASTSTSIAVDPSVPIIAAWRSYWNTYLAVGAEIHMPDARPSTPTTTAEERAKRVADRLEQAEAATARKDYSGTIDRLPILPSVSFGSIP